MAITGFRIGTHNAPETHFIFTVTRGSSPLRPEIRIELRGADWLGDEQPHCVSRRKLNLRGRNLPQSNDPAATATMLNAINSCQFTPQRYADSAAAQPDVSSKC